MRSLYAKGEWPKRASKLVHAQTERHRAASHGIVRQSAGLTIRTMAIPILLVAAASRRLASAQMPRALARAGFEPSLLAQPGSLAEHSPFVSKLGHLPGGNDLAQWVFAFAAIVKATSPRLVIPCDPRALRFLYMLALTPPEGLEPTLQSQLAALIRES